MLPKSEDVTGRHYNWPIVVASGQARSAAYSEVSTAEALSGEVTKVFQIALTENFANANVSSRAIAETSNDKGAFLRAVSLIADNQLRNFGNDVAIAAYRTHDGNRGQVGSIGTPSGGVANSQVTMKVIDDILNIEVGMT
ncbi:MAG TPA: hypothetical protein VNH84_12755, partial [Candidatus Saccharimonadales bacterium]|nr:hypothetical protein [Candidatus Saccharimonadales bacterium]